MRRHHLLLTAVLAAVAFFATCSPSYAARGGSVGPRGGAWNGTAGTCSTSTSRLPTARPGNVQALRGGDSARGHR